MPEATFEAVCYSALPEWGDNVGLDNALRAFADCRSVLKSNNRSCGTTAVLGRLSDLSDEASKLVASGTSSTAARRFFETNFQPHRVIHSEQKGLLTGYFEPVLRASRQKVPGFEVPIYRRPPDLVDLDKSDGLLAGGYRLTHARMVKGRLSAFPKRSEIEQGALDDCGLDLAYVGDPVDAFFLHVQGSGVLQLSDHENVRIGYDGKNGHPYTSIGRLVIDQGWIQRDEMTLQKLGDWLRCNPGRARDVMWANASFVFFKELGPITSVHPTGVDDIPLTAGTSLAVDTNYYALGQPVFVSSPELKHAPWCANAFNRLMIAQDIGSAIVGPERGDIYFGTGQQAGDAAGKTACQGTFFVLLPKQPSAT